MPGCPPFFITFHPIFGDNGISEDAVFRPPLDCLFYTRSSLKIHVCDPKRKFVRLYVPFKRIRSYAFGIFIKIVFHLILVLVLIRIFMECVFYFAANDFRVVWIAPLRIQNKRADFVSRYFSATRIFYAFYFS